MKLQYHPTEAKRRRAEYTWNLFNTEFNKHNLKPDIFLESGTFEGDISLLFSEKFNYVHSIEIHEQRCELLRERFKDRNNIALHEGDAEQLLPAILETIDEPVAFWLDAHYSGPDTGGDPNYIPIVEELQAIVDWGLPCVILIDDVNKFGSTHNQPDYPQTGYRAHTFDWTHISESQLNNKFRDYFDSWYAGDLKRRVLIKK